MSNRIGEPPPKLRRHHLLESVNTKTFTPREYQVELLDSARKKNTVVCLGTGTGKTFIAVMAVKELAHQVRGSYDNGGKRTVFLVPTRPLVFQHTKVLEDYTDLKIEKYVGNFDANTLTKEAWNNELRNNQVLVMTPDLFKMILQHGIMPLSKVNLLIFDECHRAVKKHPYCEVMRCFDVCPAENQPRILGLSASLINGKCKPSNLEQEIRNLEKVMRSSVETASDLTVLSKYGSKPHEYVAVYSQYYNNSIHYYSLLTQLNLALVFIDDMKIDWNSEKNPLPHPCKQPRRYLMEISHTIVTLGPWCTQRAVELFKDEIIHILDQLISERHRHLLLVVLTVLQMISVLCENMLKGKDALSRLIDTAPDKLHRLLSVLRRFKPEIEENNENNEQNDINGESKQLELEKQNCRTDQQKFPSVTTDKQNVEDSKTLCGIVFVRQRITACILNQWLTEISKHHPDYKFIVPNFIVGHGKARVCAVKEDSMAFRKQEEVLQKFRTREYNLLVATSVVEEGMDVPRCNLVIRFDIPENFRAYIQSKGRARAPDSLYVLMVQSNEKEEFVEDLCDYKTVEEIQLEKCHERDLPTEDEIADFLADQMMEPYMPIKEDGAPRVTMSSAIALVNRYCAKLPSDTFTRLTPWWKTEELTPNGYQCTIHLPINSPLKKPIVGAAMKSKQLAKMAAALKTCEELHLAGELDDNLLPTGKEAVKFEDNVLEEFENEIVPPGSARPGTTKRRQYYYKQVSEALKGSLPEAGTTCYLYMFQMKLTCPIPEEQNTRGRKIHDPADTSRGFGVITSKPIPPICSFPVFTRSGEVTVRLEFLDSGLCFSEEQLEQLRYFHKYTFADVLRLEKYPMLYNPKETESSFLIAPVEKNADEGKYSVDWSFVGIISHRRGISPRKIPEEERKNFIFEVEKYLDAVVMPWYRNLDKPQFFYVAEICENLNPKSDFPDAGYETFEGYYKKKYSISIMNSSQPLLDVDHTSARLNLLTPRYVNRKGVTLPTSSEQTKKAKRENLQQKQILIPELCIIHPFPASLWRKAVCLPCILYRVNSLLLAEQVRLTVAKEILVGVADLGKDFQWPMLDFGWTLADVLKAQAALKEDEAQKPHEENFEESFTRRMNGSGNDDPFSIGTWPSDISNNSGDFVIDTFDPSKVEIPDDDFLVDQELSRINFGPGNFIGGPSSDFQMWSPITKPERDSPEMQIIRYGSPSNFEGTGWDSEWDTDNEDTNFFTLNLPGLGYISAPGVFNMEGLSLDLASCRDDDLWDSMDEESLYDETEMGKMAPPPNPHSPNLANEIHQISSLKETTGEICESVWLSSCLQGEIYTTTEDNRPDVIDKLVELEVKNKRENKKNEIQFLEKDYENDDDSDESCNPQGGVRFPKLDIAIRQIQECDDSSTEKDFSDSLATTYEQPQNDSDIFSSKCVISDSDDANNKSTESTLAFGELLPDREKLQSSDNGVFRVHFDEQPDLSTFPGPSPSIILQAFTMSNANDGINLERLETVGDSFLKYAITAYLFCTYPDIHEGKLSYLRSKQISNLNLYRLGKKKRLGELMVATKFEPNDNWLPPCYTVPKGLEQALIESGMPAGHWNIGSLNDLTQMSEEQIRQSVMEKKNTSQEAAIAAVLSQSLEDAVPYIPYNLLTQHSIPDKSIADCVEALIGAYLVSCGPRGALLYMSWLGLRVLPPLQESYVIVTIDVSVDNKKKFGYLEPPPSPLLTHIPNADKKLDRLLSGYAVFEQKIGYTFQDKAYLLQAFTHASYHYNCLTDCYQRLEFLGDAVLDYLITRHLYEDPQKHSPGTLTDLRSALVNNTFFASLAVKYDFHKYFKSISPGLFNVINKFVEMKKKSPGFEDYEQEYFLEEEECEEAEEVEVPKALGDIFESVAGAIYLDSKMSLDVVWRVYYAMMKPEIEYFSTHVPKSPIRELLEMEPQTAKFERAEMTLSGKVRVRVDVFDKGQFVGVGRNKRIAKCTAAKRALRELKKMKKEKEAAKKKF